MSTRFASRIDLLNLPRKGVRFNLNLAVADLRRLGENLTRSEGSIEASFHVVERSLVNISSRVCRGRFWHMTGAVSGVLTLRCERCLTDFDWALNAAINVGVVGDDADSVLLPENMESHCVEDFELNAIDVIEDEVILAMPSIPAHPDVASCGELVVSILSHEKASGMDDSGQAVPDSKEQAADNPFAVLASLKSSPDGPNEN